MTFSDFFWPCFYSFWGCVGFCLLFHIRPRRWMMPVASLGGAIAWGVYLLCSPVQNDIIQYFVAALAVTAYSEGMARLFKSPATCYLIVGLIPLVPGGGIYYTMEYGIRGDTMLFLENGMHTLGIAGALAIGVLMVSGIVRIAGARPRRDAERR